MEKIYQKNRIAEKFREFKKKYNQKYFNYNQINHWARDYIKFKREKKYINIL